MDAATDNHTSLDGAAVQKKRGRPKGVTKKVAPAQAANPSDRITAAQAKKQALKATTGNASNKVPSDKVERRGRPKGTKNKTTPEKPEAAPKKTKAEAAPKKTKTEVAPKKTKAEVAPKKTKAKAAKVEEAQTGEKRKRGRPAKADKGGNDEVKPAKKAKKAAPKKDATADAEPETEVADAEEEKVDVDDDQEASELQLKAEEVVIAGKQSEEEDTREISLRDASNMEDISEF